MKTNKPIWLILAIGILIGVLTSCNKVPTKDNAPPNTQGEIDKSNSSKNIKKDTGAYVGQADSNSIEIRMTNTQEKAEDAFRVFKISDEVRSQFEKLALQKDDTIQFEYYEQDQGQPVLTSIGIVARSSSQGNLVKGEGVLYTTQSWYSFEPLDSSEKISYNMVIPNDWEPDGKTFLKNGYKVAEIGPAVKLAKGQSLLNNFNASGNEGEYKLLSEEPVTIGEYTGKLRIFEIAPSGGDIDIWYPHTYYLAKDDVVFQMTFYTLDKDIDADRVVQQQVLKTLHF